MEIAIPDEILASLKLPRGEVEKEVKIELAAALYRREALSLGKATELSELPKKKFLEELSEREIPRHYTEKELEEDLEFARSK